MYVFFHFSLRLLLSSPSKEKEKVWEKACQSPFSADRRQVFREKGLFFSISEFYTITLLKFLKFAKFDPKLKTGQIWRVANPKVSPNLYLPRHGIKNLSDECARRGVYKLRKNETLWAPLIASSLAQERDECNHNLGLFADSLKVLDPLFFEWRMDLLLFFEDPSLA